jgi:signal transduction histidine kinase/CheY-like chemotaxis protein/HAMP domain-containing protein
MKLTHKLILGFLVVALLSWITGYFAVTISRGILEKTFIKNVEFMAVEILDGIEEDLQKKIGTFQEHSRNSLFLEEISKSNQAFQKLEDIQAYINQKDMEWLSTPKDKITTFIKDITDNDASKGLRDKTGFYKDKYGYDVFPEVFATNIFGANVAQTGKTTDYRQDDEEWWQITKRDGLYIGVVVYDDSANVYSTDIGLRIDDEKGNPIGLMKIVVNIEGVFQLIHSIQQYGIYKEHSTMMYKIIDRDGKLIYSTGDFIFLEDASYLLPKNCSQSHQGKHEIAGTFNNVKHEGKDVLITHAHSRGLRDLKLGWILVVEQESEKLFAPVTRLKNRILTAALIVTIAGILIGFVISDSISKALRKLIDATARIGRGDLDAEIKIKSNDEIGQLSTAFEQMTKDLKSTTVKRDELALEIIERRRAEEAMLKVAQGVSASIGEKFFYSLAEHLADILKADYAYIAEIIRDKPNHVRTLSLFADGKVIDNIEFDLTGTPCEAVLDKDICIFQSDVQNKFPDAFIMAEMNVASYAGIKLSGSNGESLGILSVMYLRPLKHTSLIESMLKIFALRAASELERRHAEKEQEKLSEELQKSHKLESIGILAGGIAHDFNNLLTAITNNVYLTQQSVDRNSSAFHQLEQVVKAIYKATNLTDQLLTFSRGGTPIKETASITDIINESVHFTLRGSNVSCEYNLPEDLWAVEVDTGQISQVIQNLVINADQSMPEGGTLCVHGENVIVNEETGLPLHSGKYVKMKITDHGQGISEENLQRLFDPFFTTKEMGRGLGLSVTYSIIKRHAGHIEVESMIGKGTTFTIYLPASKEKISKGKNDNKIFFEGEGRLLIMDDEEMVRDSMGQILTAAGYHTDFAKNGDEAIEMFDKARKSSYPFDIVILDLTVPGGMGGKETIKKLLAIDPETKAVVSSGYSSDPVMSDFKAYGFRDFIVKPYKPDELIRVLHEVINGQYFV